MRAPGRMLVHALFFASGATALVYQVVWVRSLSLILGASHLAVSIVLAAFMGGLALGAVWIGRRVASRAHPLRVYGWLELGIAACALALPFALRVVQAVYVSLALALEDRAGGAAAASGARALLAFAVLVLPTFLMGGTLPVLVAAVVRRHADLHARLASLYAINTAGAAAGAGIAGFALLPALGVRETTLCAAAGNLAIGAAALAWQRASARGGAPPELAPLADSEPGPRPVAAGDEATALRLVFSCTAVCGFGALALEVLWTRAISVVIGSNVYSFTVMLVAFLCGIALGSAIHGALPRGRSEGAHFAWLAGAIAVSTLGVSLAIPRLPELLAWLKPLQAGGGFDLWTALALCFGVMLVPCVLHGMAFPLAGEARARLAEGPARSVGDLVGLNTAGSIAGSLGAGFVLIPWLGLQRSLLGISALYASACIVLAAAVWSRGRERRGWVAAGAAAATLLVWLGAFSLRPWDTRRMGAFRNNESVDLRRAREAPEVGFAGQTLLYYREGRGSTVSVVEDAAGVRRLQIDGKVVASDASSDLRHELLLGHLPVLAHPAPRSALVVGLGAGVTLGAVAAHPELESITAVEIEPAVEPASRFFAHLQGDPLEDPRVRLVVQDGRNYLLGTSRRFDVITADPIHPWVRGSGYLYTREYYEVARAHLREGGVMCQWLPLYQLGPDDLRAAAGAFVDVFPDATLWSTPADAVMIGTTRPLQIDLPDWQRRLAGPAVERGLARVGLSDPLSLLAEFTLSPDGMRDFAAGARRNTDDNVFLEFDSPRYVGGGAALLASNSRLLASRAESPAPFLGAVSPPFGSRTEALQALAAVLDARRALAELLARDAALPDRIARLREIGAGPPRYGPALDELAWQLRLQGRDALDAGDAAAAELAFAEATRLAPLDWRSRVELAWALRRRAAREEAARSLREALALAPHAPPAHYELAGVLLESGRREEAMAELRAAALARPDWADPRNDLAWLLVTDPASGEPLRREGLALAESAAALSGSRDPQILDTLAVAYAANGRAGDARAVVERAVALARAERPALVPQLEARSAAIARGELGVASAEGARSEPQASEGQR